MKNTDTKNTKKRTVMIHDYHEIPYIKRRVGRPDTFNWEYVKDELDAYIQATEDPQLKEICLRKDMPSYDAINERMKIDEELRQMGKDLIAKQEVFLTRQTNVMSLFRLKQKCHGYTDTQKVDINDSREQTITVKLIGEGDDVLPIGQGSRILKEWE